MWRNPGFCEELVESYGYLDKMYKGMLSSDLSEVVVTALEFITKTGTVPKTKIEKKCDAVSTDFRKQGNQAYLNKKYHEALVLYNKALKYAPNKSKVMKLAYSNRSALLITVKAFSACINDIENVFEMDCPPEIHSKLRQRYEDAHLGLQEEDSCWSNIDKFDNTYFKLLYAPRQPQISCITKNVGIVMENNFPKIVAANDIKVGTVLAVEPGFVSHLSQENFDIACYYCHKLDYNLIPCVGCCHVLFCNELCMHECMEQYHSVECKIMDLIQSIEGTESIRLAVKAAIKMKLHSLSWKSLIAASKVYGINRLKTSSISEIFDKSHTFSVLNFKENRHFIHGVMYNSSFILAAFIHCLGMVSGFLPNLDDRYEAIKCLGRIMMYLTLFGNPTLIDNAASINDTPDIDFHDVSNFGLFAFAGQLRNSCTPNVLTVGLNDKIGLIALQPIKSGSELTVTYLGHWLDKVTSNGSSVRNRNMFLLYATICDCVICSGEWKHKINLLSQAQKASYNKIILQDIDFSNLSKMFKSFCRTLAILHDVPFSKEYVCVYKLLRACIMHLQQVETENVVLRQVCPTNPCEQ